LPWGMSFMDSCSQFENNYFTETCSGSEAGSYSRLIDFVYHSTLGLRVIKKKKDVLHGGGAPCPGGCASWTAYCRVLGGGVFS